MTKTIRLNDVINIQPKVEYLNLSKTEKHKLMDSVLSEPTSEKKRGLKISFELSAAGKKINNRIYTPQGQFKGLDSWMKPFPKPIILNHDETNDPLGRFSDVRFESLDNVALGYFKTASSFMKLKDSFEDLDHKKIYDNLFKNNLLLDKRWPGVSRLMADAHIYDESAIEKFLDGRYLTFSAGSHTDSYVCTGCYQDWVVDGPCGHRPGEVTEDGDLVLFITGLFLGDEGSIINKPANDTSMIESMSFVDSEAFNLKLSDEQRSFSDDKISMQDAEILADKVDDEIIISDELLAVLVAQDIYYRNEVLYTSDTFFEELSSETRKELDMLASQVIGYNGSDATDVANLISTAFTYLKDWTSAVDTGGQIELAHATLDTALEKCSESDVLKAIKSSHDNRKFLLKQRNEMKIQKTEDQEVADKSVEEKSEEHKQAEEAFSEVFNMDWKFIDMAFAGFVFKASQKDSEFKVLATEELTDEDFIGQDSTFPVPNKAYLNLALDFVKELTLEETVKDHILCQLIARQEVLDKVVCDCENNLKDLSVALAAVEDLKNKINSLEEKLAEKEEQRDTIVTDKQTTVVQDLELVENPSCDSSDSMTDGHTSKKEEKLSPYEKKIKDRFEKIKKESGADVAYMFLSDIKSRGYLASNFEITLMES